MNSFCNFNNNPKIKKIGLKIIKSSKNNKKNKFKILKKRLMIWVK